mgnify:CR=1 FL=1
MHNKYCETSVFVEKVERRDEIDASQKVSTVYRAVFNCWCRRIHKFGILLYERKE